MTQRGQNNGQMSGQTRSSSRVEVPERLASETFAVFRQQELQQQLLFDAECLLTKMTS